MKKEELDVFKNLIKTIDPEEKVLKSLSEEIKNIEKEEKVEKEKND